MALLTGLGLWGATKAANDIGGAPPQVSGDSFGSRSLRRTCRDEFAPNLLLSTLMLASMAAASLCRGPVESAPRHALTRVAGAEQNWILSIAPQVQAQVPFTNSLFERARSPRLNRTDAFQSNALIYSPPNIGLTTPDDFATKTRLRFRSDDVAPNLLTATLAGQTVVPPFLPIDLQMRAARPRVALDSQSSNALLLSGTPAQNIDHSSGRSRRPTSKSDEPSGSLLLAELSLPGAPNVPFFAPELPSLKPRIGKTTEEAPNLILGTFSIAVQSVLPFASGEWPVPKIRRFAQADGWPNSTLQTLQLAPTLVLPFASGEWPIRPVKRFGTRDEALNLAISTLALVANPAPFVSVELAQIVRRRVFTNEQWQSLVTSVLSAAPAVCVDYSTQRSRSKFSAELQLNLLATTLRAPQITLPFASGEWLAPKIKRFAQDVNPPNLQLTTFSSSPSVVSVAIRTVVFHRKGNIKVHR